jgi:hypothetical protein
MLAILIMLAGSVGYALSLFWLSWFWRMDMLVDLAGKYECAI